MQFLPCHPRRLEQGTKFRPISRHIYMMGRGYLFRIHHGAKFPEMTLPDRRLMH